MGQSDVEEQHAAVNGMVEVRIGTIRDPCGNQTNDNANAATNQRNVVPETTRRSSVMSLMSMLSLPPAYSLVFQICINDVTGNL